ncbi:hypothetical protein AS9A_P20034 (plasmid) [Hoyosella subflava DQS3-9A1]|uniref:Uncharacterized protein n=1 Tax=Hoyosella subflava (strain DSM 45089 / JCM 17490 / NBRC 109087 / DQS3-9A1) TaxID=443218 RepID=F6ESF8_HOYSD|nr:hypothetical protein AS9A_P20034 [Hoyosella subflava DQS3-9A1]
MQCAQYRACAECGYSRGIATHTVFWLKTLKRYEGMRYPQNCL